MAVMSTEVLFLGTLTFGILLYLNFKTQNQYQNRMGKNPILFMLFSKCLYDAISSFINRKGNLIDFCSEYVVHNDSDS